MGYESTRKSRMPLACRSIGGRDILQRSNGRLVPEWAEAEILDNEYLEVEATLEPATTTDEKLAKMVVPKVKRGKTL